MTSRDILKNLTASVEFSDNLIVNMTELVGKDPMKFIRWHTEDLAIACLVKQHATRYINFINRNLESPEPEFTDEQLVEVITKDIIDLVMKQSPCDTSSMSARLIDNYATPNALRCVYKDITGYLC